MSDTLVGDRYRLVRAIGRGAVGEVWLADDLVLSRPVALKRLGMNPAAGVGSEAIERMVREARVAARLHHPNVVSVFDLLLDGGQPYVVMEYVDGESLEARMQRGGPLPIDEARRIAAQVAEGLAAAHARGIVHRDVKPANIMLDATRAAKLADFGIARAETDSVLTMTGQTVGTIAYMAPEVARGEAATSASDIWSLGVTLFAATEGRSPYDDGRSQSAIGMLMRIASEPAPPIPSGPLRPVIEMMLATAPADRPSARDVARELGGGASTDATSQLRSSDDTVPSRSDARSVEITLDRPAASRGADRASARRSERRRTIMLVGAGVVVLAATAAVVVTTLPASHRKSPPGALQYSLAQLALTGDGASGAYASSGPDEYLGSDGGVAVLDSSSGRRVGFIPLDPGKTVSQVIVASTGDVAYVTAVASTLNPFKETGTSFGELFKVRLASRQAGSPLGLCGNPVPRGMVLSPDGRRLLIAEDGCNEVVDTATLQMLHLRTSPGAGSAPPPTITADSRTGWVAEANGTMDQVDMVSGVFTGRGILKGARGMLASPDGKYLYVYSPYGLFGGDSVRGQLEPLSLATGTPIPRSGTITLGFGAYIAAASPDGRYVVTASSGYDSSGRQVEPGYLTIISTKDDSFSYNPVRAPSGRGTIAFSADGSSVLVACDSGITKVDLATRAATVVHGVGPWLFRSADADVMYASDGKASGIAIDVRTGAVLRPVSLSG